MDSLGGITMFVAVAETRSFTKAANQFGVSSSAVGKSIARMEERLAVRLFHRSTRSITLTAEGALFLQRCRRILGEVEAAEAELSELSGAPRGRLRVSTPQLTSLIMPTLTGFMHKYPDITLEIDLSERMVDIIEDDLKDGRLRIILEEYMDQTVTFSMLWPTSRHASPKLRAFIDYVAANMRI